MNPFGLGAHESAFDPRTWQHENTTATPVVSGGYHYDPTEIEHQHSVGICTAISLVQNAQKALGKKFSPDFHYLIQKKYYDLNWYEGSSIFNALKAGKNIGFLPIGLFTHVTEQDRLLPYSQYIAKLQAIPDVEIVRLMALCTDKLTGYAAVETDTVSLSKAINDSTAGILTRYDVGSEWWTSIKGYTSWLPVDIDPLRAPKSPVSGHAIGTSYFDYTSNPMLDHPNTWGTDWNMKGIGHTNHNNYKCTEAWIPYYSPVKPNPQFIFTTDFGYASLRLADVKKLQEVLIAGNYVTFKTATGFFGSLTFLGVKAYQKAHNIPTTGYVGPLTRAHLNT